MGFMHKKRIISRESKLPSEHQFVGERRKRGAHRESIVRPTGPFQLAILNVEGEVLHGDLATRPEDAVTQPDHGARVVDDDVGVDDGVVVVGVRVVVQDDVGSPQLVEGQADGADVAEVRRVPRQVRVVPHVRDPAVRGQDLVLLVHVDDLVDADVEHDVNGLAGVAHRPHALLVVGHQVLRQAVLVLARAGRGQKPSWGKENGNGNIVNS